MCVSKPCIGDNTARENKILGGRKMRVGHKKLKVQKGSRVNERGLNERKGMK